MPPVLLDRQFQLGDDGPVFGFRAPVDISSWAPAATDVRTADQPNPSGDGIRMGKDFKGALVWSFSMFTNGDTEEEGWNLLADLARVWDNDDVRLESGAVMPLYYCLSGRQRVIYGRPRRWTPIPDRPSMSGRIDIEADFVAVDHTYYDSIRQEVSFPLAPPSDPEAGFVVPYIPPYVPTSSSVSFSSSITVTGEKETPISVAFVGPVRNPLVRVGDWTAALSDFVDAGDVGTIDARPWVRSATTSRGGGLRVNPRVTRISKMVLEPGTYPVTFTGEDLTGTATALLSWQGAYRTVR